MAKFDKSVLEKYGITGTTEVLLQSFLRSIVQMKKTKRESSGAMKRGPGD